MADAKNGDGQGQPYRFHGTVRDAQGAGVPGLRVEVRAENPNTGTDLRLGSSDTDGDGEFDVSFQLSQTKRSTIGQRPQVYVKALHPGDPLVPPFTKPVTWDAGQHEYDVGSMTRPSLRIPEGTFRQVDEAINEAVPFMRGSRQALEDVAGSARQSGARLTDLSDTVQDTLPLAREALEDVAAYMPTAHQSPGSGNGPSLLGSGWASAPNQQRVEAALSAELGRRLRADRPRAFVEALTRAYPAVEVDGKTTYQWTPHAFFVQVDLHAEITGGQASFLHRAQVDIDDALKLLGGLEALRPAPDEEEVDAARAIVRKELTEILEEAGREGGPRVQRMDDLFTALFVQLDLLEEVFGFDEGHINTVGEERHPTDYQVILGHAVGLNATWADPVHGLRAHLTGNAARPFLGTQFVLLQRSLSVIAESVDETYRAMDSVLLGPAERQTVYLDFTEEVRLRRVRQQEGENVDPLFPVGGEPPRMSVEDLLSWAHEVATDEWQELIREGGRLGVAVIVPVADRLRRLFVIAAEAQAVPHVGFTRTRVRRALVELNGQFEEVRRLAAALLPTSVGQGQGARAPVAAGRP